MKSTVFKTPATVQITSATAEFEQHALHVWAQLGDKPNTARFGFNLDAALFWQKMLAYFPFSAEDVHCASEHLASDEGELVGNMRYLVRLEEGLYLSCMEYTQDTDFAPWESVQMLPRKVADIALFYADAATHKTEAVTSVLYMMRLPETVDGSFSVAAGTPYGYKAQLSVLHEPDQVDVRLFYGLDAVDLVDVDGPLPNLIAIYGPPRTGKTSFMHLLLAGLRREADVLYVPKQLYPVVGDEEFAAWVDGIVVGTVAFDDAEELVESGALAKFAERVKCRVIYTAASACAGFSGVSFGNLGYTQAKMVSEALEVACGLQEGDVVSLGDLYGYAPEELAEGEVGYDVSSVR